MNLQVHAMTKELYLEVHFVTDLSSLPKLIKSGERIIWFDYGTNVDEATLPLLYGPFPTLRTMLSGQYLYGVGYNVLDVRDGRASLLYAD